MDQALAGKGALRVPENQPIDVDHRENQEVKIGQKEKFLRGKRLPQSTKQSFYEKIAVIITW